MLLFRLLQRFYESESDVDTMRNADLLIISDLTEFMMSDTKSLVFALIAIAVKKERSGYNFACFNAFTRASPTRTPCSMAAATCFKPPVQSPAA